MMDELNDILGQMLQINAEQAKRDPRKHKTTTVFENRLSYRYGGYIYSRGKQISYCWSCHRNVAGYFLGWREIVHGDKITRDNFTARRVKKRLKELQLRRTIAHRSRLLSGGKK